jgi:TetR/AcrR family transcriptional repressor of bet genes
LTGKEMAVATTKRTATREARRQQLIDATIASISQRGFSGTTLTAVTTGAGLSHGVVNFHFKTKDALYDATLGYLADEHYQLWSQAMNDAGPEPEKKLAAIIEVDFQKDVCSQEKIAVWYAFWGRAKYRPSYLKINSDYDSKRYQEISKLCAQIIENGNYQNLEAESVARTILAVIDGSWLNLLLCPLTAKAREHRGDCFALLANYFPKHFTRNS